MRQIIRLSESELKRVIAESVNNTLMDYEYNKQDDDNYYGGGLPEPQERVSKYTCEKEVNQIYQKIKPYLDQLADIFNTNEVDSREVYDKIMDALNVMDLLPSIGKQFYELDYD